MLSQRHSNTTGLAERFVTKPTNDALTLVSETDKQMLKKHIEEKYGVQLNKPHRAPLSEEAVRKYNGLFQKSAVTADGLSLEVNTTNHRRLKERVTLVNINSIQRDQYIKTMIEPNQDGLYLRETVDDDGVIRIEQYNAEMLNNEYIPKMGDMLRPYVDQGDKIYRYDQLFRYPNSYQVRLPRVFTNVKSVRLIGSEIPNTISNINQNNNLITIDVIDQDIELTEEEFIAGVTTRVPLKPDITNPFFVIMVEPGNYTLTSLIDYLQTKINQTIQTQSIEGFSNLFTVTSNTQTGVIAFKLNDPPGRSLLFNINFHSNPGIAEFGSLWYMMGFNAPLELDMDGTTKYVKTRSNQMMHGIHKIASKSGFGAYPNITVHRYPTVNPSRYIYLAIEGLGTMIDLSNPKLSNFSENRDLFAKFTISQNEDVSINKFTAVPKIFLNAPLSNLDRLKIKWHDHTGALVDFQNRDHSFALEIVEYIDWIDINDFSSRRGVTDLTHTTENRDRTTR